MSHPAGEFGRKPVHSRHQVSLARPRHFAILAGFHQKRFASVAQLAEQLICNQQVEGSSPSAGSIRSEGFPSGQRGQTVNLMAYAFVGSNPTPSIAFGLAMKFETATGAGHDRLVDCRRVGWSAGGIAGGRGNSTGMIQQGDGIAYRPTGTRFEFDEE